MLLNIMAAMAVENYPYRSDFLWVTTPDHADWLYKTGEKANVEVQLFKYGYAQDVKVDYEVAQDMMPASTKGSVKLKNGKAVINIGTRTAPGFTDLVLK
ncbi:MAG: acetylxylan esterase, partial [Prevotella sp.]|nr:acetylxylan esterase [Prevotella sp.]